MRLLPIPIRPSSEMSEKVSGELRCSFCGKSRFEVGRLVAGPTVYICDQCIDICNAILAEYEAQASDNLLASANFGGSSTDGRRMITPEEVRAIADSDRSDDAKLAALHLLHAQRPGVFCWELLNELRHHYGGRDERASMVFCNGILERSPDDEYILNILSGWKLGEDAGAAAAVLESVADRYPDLPHVAAACLRKARLLRGPD